MPPLSLLIKPASSSCNLRCKYCFYHSIAENRNVKSYGLMKISTLEQLVKKSFDYAEISCCFAFQGGEPTMAGLDFYRKLIEYQKKYNTKHIKVLNAIQTNGLLIDEKWGKFLSENNFLTGISLDGPKDIHDMNRVTHEGKGSFSQAMHAIDLFKKHGVEFNILTVVNSQTSRHVMKIYNFFKKQGFKYLQFIPCLDPLNEEPGGHEYSLTPQRYIYFLKSLFDLWYSDIMKGEYISIRYFDNLVSMMMGHPPESCGMSGICNLSFVIEGDGSTYPCDFYVLDEWCLGNIFEDSFDNIMNSKNANEFINSSKHVAQQCKNCPHFVLCRGGCRRNREPFIGDLPALNYFCQSFKEFFSYATPRLRQIANIIVQ